MDTKSAMKLHPICCPVLEIECPQGEGASAECQQRFDSDFNPMNNWRDMAILQCAANRQEQYHRMNELPPLV